MRHLAAFVESRARNAQAIQLALIYPALLALVSAGIVVLLMTYVMPDIVRVFTARGADLPLLTRGLIVVSEALRSYGLAGAADARRWPRSPGGAGWRLPGNRLRVHRLLAREPRQRPLRARG